MTISRPGRIFASHKQFDQTARMFGSHWYFQLTHSGTFIGCHYGCSEHNQYRLHVDETKRRRKQYYSPKDCIKCPFAIRYSRVDYSSIKSNQPPKVYYRSKIISTNFTHTCDLNTRSHIEARRRTGVTLPDLNGVQDLVPMLRHRPTLSCANLQSFFVRYMPHYQAAYAQLIINLRRR